MSMSTKYAGPVAVALLFGVIPAACNSGARGTDDTAAAPIDTAQSDPAAAPIDTAQTAAPTETTAIAQPEAPRDTPPAGAAQPSGQAAGGGGPKVSQIEYEGWRQYSVNCARCHGQDVLPNPVAANLLISLAPGGTTATYEKFSQVVSEGRPDRGMPAFKSLLTSDQIKAIYAYVKGRAEKRIPPGRPASPPA
jgi:mono/diheme cytochrome c family protein